MGEVSTYQVNGVLLACETDGPQDGPPVMLLHALGEDRGSWRAVAAGLAADGWRTLAVDLRGHGESGHPGAYAFESMRDDVLALLDALHLDTVTLVAHSMGTVAASLVAMDRPGAVRRMVLEEGPMPFPADPPRPVPATAPEEPTPYDWRVVPAVAGQRNAPPARHLAGLAEITAPTLVVAGGPRSHIPQDQLARTAAAIPGARLITIEAGHMVHDERPDDFLAVVRDFLGRPPAPDSEPPVAFVPVRVTAGRLRAEVAGFAALLVDAVDSGASVGFHGPLAVGDAVAWWEALARDVAAERVELWAAFDYDGVVRGTVQLHRPDSPNAGHRAEIAKLLVHRAARRKGLARMLLRVAEASAWGDGVRLLLLDTQTGSAADHLYQAEGWTPAGTVPDYAADPGGVLRPTTFFFKSLPDEAV
ncbi:bifunctional alpha/beta hydrolase/GNAT family N-acetyltransferase [Actinacidiphila acidipaludis]|uniref:Alpha/beta fold hydrolase n=1 Tax=Actinacidiphila acidipaludis TaxID=2873382 RepID=A0ABS7QD60_9ACTN|nr:bifunctional alpha/beta hydrolase/GNAT family N-acetyltransferase [Streptomyces acidipaludis]MBY8880624.1 alpha/beta fold hydrolase [Streptomyces acidipaludis]